MLDSTAHNVEFLTSFLSLRRSRMYEGVAYLKARSILTYPDGICLVMPRVYAYQPRVHEYRDPLAISQILVREDILRYSLSDDISEAF